MERQAVGGGSSAVSSITLLACLPAAPATTLLDAPGVMLLLLQLVGMRDVGEMGSGATDEM